MSSRRNIKQNKNTAKNKSIRKNNTRRYTTMTKDLEELCKYKPSENVWPPNNGCVNNETEILLPAGMLLDRFGSNYGYYFSNPPNSYASRSLNFVKPHYECETIYNNSTKHKSYVYSQFIVRIPFKVKTCEAAPAFLNVGGAPQYRTYEDSINPSDPTYGHIIDIIRMRNNEYARAMNVNIHSLKEIPTVDDLLKAGYMTLEPFNISQIPSFN